MDESRPPPTIPVHAGETADLFIARLQRDYGYQIGRDTLELIYTDHRIQEARLWLRPSASAADSIPSE